MSNRTRSNFASPGIHGGGSIHTPSPKFNNGQGILRIPSPVIRPSSASSGVILTRRQQTTTTATFQSHTESTGSPGFPTPSYSPMATDPFSPAGSHFASPLKVYKNYQAWIQSAKASTEEIKKSGSPYPLVWVLVEGKNIPATALVGGEDQDGLLYIARSFFEGGLYIGKAGHHLHLGAAIPYNGKEVPVPVYEVLVPAFTVFRYALSETAITGQISHMSLQTERYNELKVTISVEDLRTYERLVDFKATLVIEEYERNVELKEFKASIIVENNQILELPRDFVASFHVEDTKSFRISSNFGASVNIHGALRSSQFFATIVIDELYSLRQLSEVKTVILVDDSLSMEGQRWADARDALAGVVDAVAQYGNEGVDVHFLNEDRYGLGLTEGGIVKELFDTVEPQGQTPTGEKLKEILESFYLPIIEDLSVPQKPIVIVIVTDGKPTDDLNEVIVEVARRLDHKGVPRRVKGRSGNEYRPLGLQFVQIGDDKYAAEFLRKLDDEISVEHGVRDLVDTLPFNPNDPISFTSSTLIKMLLGGIHPILDSIPSPTLNRQLRLR